MLFNPNHLHAVQIDHRPDPLDGPDISVVGGVGAQEAERPGQPQGTVLGVAIIAGAPNIDHHQAGVINAGVFQKGGLEKRAGDHSLLAFNLLVDGHGWLNARHLLPCGYPLFRKGKGRLVAGIGGIVKQDDECPAGERGRRARMHLGFGGFGQRHGNKPGGGCHFARRLQQINSGPHLLGGQGFKRMANPRAGIQLGQVERCEGGHQNLG